MPTVKTIKDVDEDAWHEFKSIAARNKMNMGKLFKKMVEDYKDKSKGVWDEILRGPKILSDEEADGMLETVRNLRKEYGFRKIK
ncbi:MAG: hypothetical protein AABX32_00825 [Nanoarchaeota archaeon]